MVSRKLPIETLQKLHLSNRLYMEQVTCHLLMLLLSARACSETRKWNSVCLEIPFARSSSLMETSQLICAANQLTDFFVMHEVQGFHLIFGWGGFCWTCFLQIFGWVATESAETCVFNENFLAMGVGWGFCISSDIISKQIIVLFLLCCLWTSS